MVFHSYRNVTFKHPLQDVTAIIYMNSNVLCLITDYKTSLVFELTAVSHQYLSVMFEHPLQDTMITG